MAEPVVVVVVVVLGEKVAPPPPGGGAAAPVGDLGGGAPLRSLLREGVGGMWGVTTEKLDKPIPTMRSLIKLMKLRNLREVIMMYINNINGNKHSIVYIYIYVHTHDMESGTPIKRKMK
jgi:hypothetical protein